METTKLSSKGQVVLPSAVRTARRWSPGTEFAVIETDDGVLLKPLNVASPFAATTLEQVFGIARREGPIVSLEAMDAAVWAEAGRRGRQESDKKLDQRVARLPDMIAADSNVVVRLLVNDDARQARLARALFEREQVFVTSTVLLETEWVLRGAFGFAAAQIEGYLRALLGLPGVSIDRPAAVARALDAYAAGLDFADALHLLLSAPGSADAPPRIFHTFDSRLRQRAARHLPDAPTAAP